MLVPTRAAVDHTPGRAQGWPDCDPDVRRWIEGIVTDVQEARGDVAAVILHGSLAMGCYHRSSSDVDLLVVVDTPPDDGARRALAVDLLAAHDRRPTSGSLELSVIDRRAAAEVRHPIPYVLHFSERWADDVRSGGSGPRGTDPDLAAHCAVARQRGVALVGATKVIGEVAVDDLLASVLADVSDTLEKGIVTAPVYGVLNLCRTLQLVTEGPGWPASKDEGGTWALEHLPAVHHPVIADALECYRAANPFPADQRKTHGHQWDEPALLALATHARTVLTA